MIVNKQTTKINSRKNRKLFLFLIKKLNNTHLKERRGKNLAYRYEQNSTTIVSASSKAFFAAKQLLFFGENNNKTKYDGLPEAYLQA